MLLTSSLQDHDPPESVSDQLQSFIHHYFAPHRLSDRLQELPDQFQLPRARPWATIAWQQINPAQIHGIDPLVFLAILGGAADTEEPIRGYTEASRRYLEPLHPAMAQLVGGGTGPDGRYHIGLWEREERQHTPAIQRIYTQLTGLQLRLVHHDPRPYQPTHDPIQDLYRHGLHRIATEYGAACLYLWLMAHTSGPLRAALRELLLDEINHLTTFMAFGCWMFPEQTWRTLIQNWLQTTLQKLWHRDRQSLSHTLRRMMQVLHWEAWTPTNRWTFLQTIYGTARQLRYWQQTLEADQLNAIFDCPLTHSEA